MIESDAPADILREFEMVNQHNYRYKNKYMRYEIGISPQDIDKLKPGDMNKIARIFALKMGLQNHQWIACTHKDTGKPHINVIANRIGVDGKVFDTTFMSNRSAQITEEISREMGLTIANDVHKEKQHQEAYTDPARQQAKDKLQQIAYFELRNNKTLEGFLYGLERKGVGIEPAKNKQGKTYGIRFCYEGHAFKASEIGREFGFNSIAKNFSSSPEENYVQQVQQHYNPDISNQHSYSGVSPSMASLLTDLFTPNGHSTEEEDNTLKHKRKKAKNDIMDDSSNKQTKRRNKFAGKEDISRETTDNILFGQIDQLREISRTNDETATKVSESVNILYKKRIPIDTVKFEQLNRSFINEMEDKLRKVKQPSKGLKWYIAMWVITLSSAFLAGYFIHEYRGWKEKAVYWYLQYEEVKK